MERHFPGFYLAQQGLSSLLDNSTIIFESELLLALFRMREAEGSCFLTILESPEISEKLWLPYDAAWRYHNQVNRVIMKEIERINSTLKHLTTCIEDIEDVQRFPYLKVDMIEGFKNITNGIYQACKEEIDMLSGNIKGCSIKDRIKSLFNDRIGNEYSEADLENIYHEAEKRDKESIPPFGDIEYTSDQRLHYHNLIVWKQILSHAKNRMEDGIFNNFIYVTWKFSQDWYYIVGDQKISTSHSLQDEFQKQVVGDRFPRPIFFCCSALSFVTEVCKKYSIVHHNLSMLESQLREEFKRFSTPDSGLKNSQTANNGTLM